MPVKNLEPENQKPAETPAPAAVAEAEPQPVRELTQTDRLNRRLLQAFLARINDPDSVYAPGPAPDSDVNHNYRQNEFA